MAFLGGGGACTSTTNWRRTWGKEVVLNPSGLINNWLIALVDVPISTALTHKHTERHSTKFFSSNKSQKEEREREGKEASFFFCTSIIGMIPFRLLVCH